MINLRAVVSKHIIDVLKKTNGNMSYAALLLGMTPSRFNRYISQIKRDGFEIPSPEVKSVHEVEIDHCLVVLKDNQGHRGNTANDLGITERHLRRILEAARDLGHEPTPPANYSR